MLCRQQTWVVGEPCRPSLCLFILKELNAAECEGLACETSAM